MLLRSCVRHVTRLRRAMNHTACFSTVAKEKVYIHDNSFLDLCNENPSSNESSKFAMIMLNVIPDFLFPPLWKNAYLRLCADGGANQVFDYTQQHYQLKERIAPDAVIGDMDSTRTEVLSYWKRHGSRIHKLPDQDINDLHKCLFYVMQQIGLSFPKDNSTMYKCRPALFDTETKQKDENVKDIIIYGSFGRYQVDCRLDHLMAVINSLYIFSPIFNHSRLIFLSEGSFVELLLPGKHKIICNQTFESIGTKCGLIPFVPVDSLNSKGLEWDLINSKCSFGGLVSTSNIIQSPVIEVECSHPVVWITSFDTN